jgi:hypothetical protein
VPCAIIAVSVGEPESDGDRPQTPSSDHRQNRPYDRQTFFYGITVHAADKTRQI